MQAPSSSLYRLLPSMSYLLDLFASPQELGAEYASRCTVLYASLPRPLLRESIETFLGRCREDISHGLLTESAELALEHLMPRLLLHVEEVSRPHFKKVINATGVVIHTNLGRSILAEEAAKAVFQAALHYSNLEFDLATGSRGSRYSHVEQLICRLTGAEAALVVNNNAAAVLLMLDTIGKGREVIVSRGELVEVGGSFRIPEIMEKSGCTLKEVGATNRTHLKDYEAALTENTAAVMKVHTSNYRIIGFSKATERAELAELAHSRSLPLLEDLGSGTLFDFQAAGLAHLSGEPTAASIIRQGVDVVCFSGDKLLGGPQAGIIAGKAQFIEPIKKNQLNRALRIDKMTLAALEATLRLYLDPQLALRKIPTLRMMSMPENDLQVRAKKLARILEKELSRNGQNSVVVSVKAGVSRTGGGAFPEQDLPTRLVCLSAPSHSLESLRHALLRTDPPLVLRVENDALCLDPRTLEDKEYSQVARLLAHVLG